jgi:hypothetical protein
MGEWGLIGRREMPKRQGHKRRSLTKASNDFFVIWEQPIKRANYNSITFDGG